MLPGRRSGYVIMILGSVLGLVIPVVHMKGAGVGAALVQSDGGFFFVWTLLALGAGAAFTLVLAARGLWGLRRGAPPSSKGHDHAAYLCVAADERRHRRAADRQRAAHGLAGGAAGPVACCGSGRRRSQLNAYSLGRTS